jgi:hypothetical protein
LADAALVRERHVNLREYRKTILSEAQQWIVFYEVIAPPGEVVLGRDQAVVISKVTGDARVLKGD